MPDSPLALIIEDSEEYLALGREILRREGFAVLVARDGETGVQLAREREPEFVIVDINLQGMDGFDVCHAIREFSDAYIVMVTGRDEEIEKVVGLRMGADDYVTKPYSAAVLGARIAAMRRRPRGGASTPTRVLGPLVVNLDARLATLSGAEIPLTKFEFELLRLLTASPGQVVTRKQLLDGVWGPGLNDSHVIDVHMANLRRKLGETASDPKLIRTVHGVGYRFDTA